MPARFTSGPEIPKMRSCPHQFRTVLVEQEVINHPTLGRVKREHRQCIKCQETKVDHLAVGHRFAAFFPLRPER